MFECMIVGDSIAVGTKMFAPKECVSYSKGGINSFDWNKKYANIPLYSNTLIISLGTNDTKHIKTEIELRKLRERVHSKRVVWIMPPCNEVFCKHRVNEAVEKIAREYHDMVIKTKNLQKDSIHPNGFGYVELVQKSLVE